MLLITLSVALMGFAPAPLPRPERERPAQKRERRLAECRRRLDELGVSWELVDHNGRQAVRFSIPHPNGRSRISSILWADGDLADVLRNLVEIVESYLRERDR